jgi:hypothetical protein
VILVGAVPGPMGHYLRTSVSRCSPRRSHPGHWGPGSRLGPWDGARGGPEGRGERGRQLAAGGSWEVAMEGDFGDGRWWGIGARRRARRGTGVGVGVGRWRWRARAQGVAAAARTGNHSPVGSEAAGARSTIDTRWQVCPQCVGHVYIYLQRLTPSWQGPVGWSKDKSQDIY